MSSKNSKELPDELYIADYEDASELPMSEGLVIILKTNKSRFSAALGLGTLTDEDGLSYAATEAPVQLIGNPGAARVVLEQKVKWKAIATPGRVVQLQALGGYLDETAGWETVGKTYTLVAI